MAQGSGFPNFRYDRAVNRAIRKKKRKKIREIAYFIFPRKCF